VLACVEENNKHEKLYLEEFILIGKYLDARPKCAHPQSL
jgi:hypothetical protein